MNKLLRAEKSQPSLRGDGGILFRSTLFGTNKISQNIGAWSLTFQLFRILKAIKAISITWERAKQGNGLFEIDSLLFCTKTLVVDSLTAAIAHRLSVEVSVQLLK